MRDGGSVTMVTTRGKMSVMRTLGVSPYRRSIALVAALLCVAAPATWASPEGLSPLCEEVLRTRSEEPIAALRAEESLRWKRARKAAREGRRLMHRAIGTAPDARAFRSTTELDRYSALHLEAMREARTLCECRAVLEDPDGANCDRLYPRVRTPEPAPTDQSDAESKEIPAEAAQEESGP